MKDYFNKDLIPLILIILLITSIGLSWYSIMITFHGFKIYLPELMVFLLVLVGVPSFFLTKGNIDTKYLLLPLLILTFMIVSSLFSIKPIVSFKETLRWGEMFAAFIITLNLMKGVRDAKVILIVVILMGIFQTLWGMKLIGNMVSSKSLVTPYFNNPNQMGFYLDFSLPLIVAFLFGTRERWWRIWWIFCFFLVGLGLCLTRSRGALISNGIVIVLFLLIFLYQRTGKSLFIGILRRTVSLSFWGLTFLSFGFFLLVAFAPGFTERLLKETETWRNSTVSARLYYYVTGCSIIEDFPLTGIGGNLSKQVAPHYVPSYAPKDLTELLKKSHVHSLFIKIGTENGILTLWAFLFFLYSVARDMFRALFVLKGENYWLLAGAGGSALAWLLHNLSDEGFSFMTIQLGILLGLIISFRNMVPESEENGAKNLKSLLIKDRRTDPRSLMV